MRPTNPHRAGDGHGERIYRPVRSTNPLATPEGRERRRGLLAARTERQARYLDALRKEIAKRKPDAAREEIREARRARRRALTEWRADVARIEREAVALVARRKREARAVRRGVL